MKPPLLALVRGVLVARVITTSSGFWEVLLEISGQPLWTIPHEVGMIWGKMWGGCVLPDVHLLERALAGRDVGEDVGETLGGHCEGM